MRKNLFNFAKLLLVGFAFAVVGCSDYDEDIKDLNNRIDQEVIAGKIDPLKMDLEKAVASLTAAQNALETEIKAAHKEDIDALKASDETLKSAIADANAAIVALKGDLTAVEAALNAKIASVEGDLNSKIDGVEDNLEAKIAEATANLDAKIAEANEKIAAANALIDGLTSDVASLKTKDAEFEKEIADLNTQLASLNTKLETELASLETELKALIDANANNIATNKDDIAANKAAIAANLAKINALQADLTNAVDAFTTFKSTVEGQIAALQMADVKINAAITEVKNSIKKLQETKLDVTDFEAYKSEVAGQFASVLMSITKLQAKDTELTNSINKVRKELQAQLDEAFANIGKNASDIAALQGEVATNKAAIAANSSAIAKVAADLIAEVAKLEAADEAISEELTAKIEGVAADLADAVKALEAKDGELAAQDEAILKLIEALEVKVDDNYDKLAKEIAKKYKELAAKDAELAQWIANVSGTVDKNAVRIDKLEAKDAEFQKAFEDYKQYVAEQILAIEKVDNEQNNRLDAAEGRLTLSEEAIKALQEKDAALDKTIEELQAAIAAAQVDINKIANRVQSIVYVPEYNDGKATVKWAALINNDKQTYTIIEAASKISYEVYPAECAEGIATLWKDNNDILKFTLKSLNDAITRSTSGETPAPALEITDVVNNNGVLDITFNARNFTPDFYENSEAFWSASLVLNYDGTEAEAAANLSSCYTQLAPSARTTEEINVALYNVPAADKKVEIEYTQRNDPETALEYDQRTQKYVLKDVYVGYTIDGGETVYTWSQMAKMGYAITAPKYQYSVTAWVPKPEDGANVFEASADALDYFEYNKIENPAGAEKSELAVKTDTDLAGDSIQVPVDLTSAATSETVGTYLTYTATYNANGVELTAAQDVVIAPNIVEINAKEVLIAWNYDDDAEVDSSLTTSAPLVYTRKDVPVEFAVSSEEIDKLLDGVKLSDIIGTICNIQNKPKDLTALLRNGSEKNTAKFELFDNFAWDKEYNLTFVYKKNPSVDVRINVPIKTVNRTDETIKIEASADVALVKDINFTSIKDKDMKLNDIYAKLTYDLGSFAGKEADFLKEVLKNKPYAQTVTVKAGDVVAAADKAGFTVNKEAATANVSFSYEAFSTAPKTVVYTKDITLWYGQKVQLVYTVNFTEPAAAYRFMHNDLWVFGNDTDGYASQVQGRYTANSGEVSKFTKELAQFSVDNINMDQAFYVYANDNKEKPLSPEELTAAGIVTEFDFVKKPADTNIKFKEEGGEKTNIIEYNGSDDFVNVNGKLYLQHSNGAKYEIKTEFDGGIYSSYRVLKFDPFTEFEQRNLTTNVIEVKKYEIDVDSLFNIYESREGDGVATVLDGDIKVDLLKDADWYVGDSKGWYQDKEYADIYAGLKKDYNNVEQQIPDKYRNAIYWDKSFGLLTFDNSYNMKLSTPVEFEIIMTIEYAWGKKVSKPVVIRFTTPELEKKNNE